jgi:hypothetical protein
MQAVYLAHTYFLEPDPRNLPLSYWDLASNLLLTNHEEVICMQYLVFSIGAGAIVLLASKACKLFERWNRRRRLHGAQECLDAVHYTLAGLAECNPAIPRAQERRCPEV